MRGFMPRSSQYSIIAAIWPPMVSPPCVSSLDLRATTIPSPFPRSQRKITVPSTTRRSPSPRRSNSSRVASVRNEVSIRVARPSPASRASRVLPGSRWTPGVPGRAFQSAQRAKSTTGSIRLRGDLGGCPLRSCAATARLPGRADGRLVLIAGVARVTRGPSHRPSHIPAPRDPCGSLRTAADRLPERPGQISAPAAIADSCGPLRSGSDGTRTRDLRRDRPAL